MTDVPYPQIDDLDGSIIETWRVPVEFEVDRGEHHGKSYIVRTVSEDRTTETIVTWTVLPDEPLHMISRQTIPYNAMYPEY